MVVSWFDQDEQKESALGGTWWEEAKLESSHHCALLTQQLLIQGTVLGNRYN